MKAYKCFVEGENFAHLIEGKRVLVGFYTTRYVEAESEEVAKEKVLAMLKAEDQLQTPEGVESAANQRVSFEKIEELDAVDIPESQPGFYFFHMEA